MALQTISILAAFPFMILMVFMAISLLRSLQNEHRQIELHEAVTRERLLRLLDEHDHLGEEGDGEQDEALHPDMDEDR